MTPRSRRARSRALHADSATPTRRASSSSASGRRPGRGDDGAVDVVVQARRGRSVGRGVRRTFGGLGVGRHACGSLRTCSAPWKVSPLSRSPIAAGSSTIDRYGDASLTPLRQRCTPVETTSAGRTSRRSTCPARTRWPASRPAVRHTTMAVGGRPRRRPVGLPAAVEPQCRPLRASRRRPRAVRGAVAFASGHGRGQRDPARHGRRRTSHVVAVRPVWGTDHLLATGCSGARSAGRRRPTSDATFGRTPVWSSSRRRAT